MNKNAVIICVVLVVLAGFVGFKLGQNSSNAKGNEENEIYALIQGKAVGAKELLPKIKGDLVSLEKNKYQVKKQAVIDWITENNKKSATEEKPAFNEDEFKAFIKERNINYPKLTKKEQVDLMGNFLIFKKMMNQKKSIEDDIATNQIVWKIPMTYLPAVEKVEAGNYPELATASGKHKIIFFANYHCPYCPQVPQKIQALTAKFKDQLSVHFRFNLPAGDTSVAFLAGVAARCAFEQKKFTEVHNAFFSAPPLEEEKIIEIVKEQNLDMAQFETCYKSDKARNSVQQELKGLEKINITGDAIAFVDGFRLLLQEPIQDFENILNLD